MKTLTIARNRSMVWSFSLHAALLLLAFFPLALQVAKKAPVELLFEVDYVDLPEVMASGSQGLQARSPIYNDEPEPTTDRPMEQPIPVVEDEPVEQTEIATSDSDLMTDVSMESDVEVTAGEPDLGGTADETHAEGGGSGSPIEGNQDGGAMAGDGGGGDGLEGDGIITRKVVRRADISQAARVNGRVTLDICIDRPGRVVTVAYDPEKTTITDKSVIKESTNLALGYRFEPNYSAPSRECGELTFIFRIDEGILAGL